MRFNLTLLEKETEIQNKILKALLPDIKNYLNKVSFKMRKRLSIAVSQAITQSPEYDSILNGQLKYEFGIPNSGSKLTSLIDIWSNNIKINLVSPQIVGNKIKASLSAAMIRIDFSDVIYTDYAEVFDNERGYSLPWLRWLLLEGSAILVKKYDVVFGANPRSRTGFAIMQPSQRSWKVPPQFSGTESNNWITRSIENSKNAIYKAVEDSLK